MPRSGRVAQRAATVSPSILLATSERRATRAQRRHGGPPQASRGAASEPGPARQGRGSAGRPPPVETIDSDGCRRLEFSVMSTTFPDVKTFRREWVLIDAKDQILGRLASRIALMLRGKHKPSFTPFLDTGDFVVVINAAKVKVTGQADAIRLGIARALLAVDPAYRAGLRGAGLLTRDPRERERKKYGRKGARKRFQWTKR